MKRRLLRRRRGLLIVVAMIRSLISGGQSENPREAWRETLELEFGRLLAVELPTDIEPVSSIIQVKLTSQRHKV